MFKKHHWGTLLKFGVFALLLLSSVMAIAQTKKTDKTGILLVSFGSSYPETQETFKNIETEIQEAFPNNEIFWAYTSKIIRKKLRSRGNEIDSPAEALAKMGEKGFTNVAVQSLHVIPGEEYENLRKTVEAFRGMPKGIQNVELGTSLMYKHEDIQKLVDALLDNLPAKISDKDAVIYMGHGTHHSANVYYPAMQYYMWQKNPSCYLATVEGYPELDRVISYLQEKKHGKVWLLPFMTIAGDHARNDMAGAEADSWKSILEAKGYDVECVLTGMAAHKSVVAIWTQHLKEIVSGFDK